MRKLLFPPLISCAGSMAPDKENIRIFHDGERPSRLILPVIKS